MLPTKFGVNWLLGLGEAKNRFSRWRPSWNSCRHNLSYFLIYKSPWCFLASLESIGLSVQEKRKIDFQDGGYLGFPIGTILAIFDLQVTLMLPSKFGVNWPFGSGEETKNRYSRWRPSWISHRHDFSYFWSTGHPDASYQVSSQLAQGWRRSRLLKQYNCWRRMTDDVRRTLTDHNSSPWALRAQVSLKDMSIWTFVQNPFLKQDIMNIGNYVLTSTMSSWYFHMMAGYLVLYQECTTFIVSYVRNSLNSFQKL